MAWGDAIAITTPNYSAVTNPQATPTSLWGDFAPPYPTNRWWNNFALGDGDQRIASIPYQLKAITQGLSVCLPSYVNSSASIVSSHLKNLSLEAVETIGRRFVTSFDDWSMTMRWSIDETHYMYSPLVKGVPYMTMFYDVLTPVLKTQHAILSVNGNGTPGSITNTRFKITMNNGQTWIIYTSTAITFTWTTAQLLADNTFNGWIRICNLANAAHEEVYNTFATVIPTAVTTNVTFSGNEATETFTFTLVGTGNFMHFILPHQQDKLVTTSPPPGITMPSLKGTLQAVQAETALVFKETLTTISWNMKNTIDPTKQNDILNALNAESLSAPGAGDPYFFGKQIARLGRLALIADQLGQTTKAATIRTNMKTYINPWLNHSNGNELQYDETWGGICSEAGLADGGADFGNGTYNDHHFHYGYFVFAAACIAKEDPTWLATYQSKVNDLLRDYANPSTSDPYFTTFRTKDFDDGHSWAHGIVPTGDGKNQESTSESINGYYGMYLWGLATGSTYIRDVGRYLLATEIRSTKKYWHIEAADTIYAAPFKNTHVVGILWATKVDYTTFFGSNTEFIFGIQNLPIMPVSEEFITENWVSEMYPTLALTLTRISPTLSDAWRNFIVGFEAVIDKESAWSNAQTITEWDDGNSKTNELYWIATRTDAVTPDPDPEPEPEPEDPDLPQVGDPGVSCSIVPWSKSPVNQTGGKTDWSTN